MDMEEDESRYLAISGIFRESWLLLRTYAKLFSSIAGTLIVPLCAMLLGHHLVTQPLWHQIHRDEFFLARSGPAAPGAEARREDLVAEFLKLAVFFTFYYIAVIGFSLLSTAAVVYSVACAYTLKPPSYRQVLSVVPKVWKRLLITFFWAFLLILGYQIVAGVSLHITARLLSSLGFAPRLVIFLLILAFFIVIFIFLTCIWHLASVISVLEESYGLAALRKSTKLIRGKLTLAFSLFFLYVLCTVVIGVCFHFKVVHTLRYHPQATAVSRMFYATLLIASLSAVTLFAMLVQTVFYFTCKSCHREAIDRTVLSEHLGAYLGEYVPLKGSIQMESLDEP